MSNQLSDDYISQCWRDARRYQGQWTGTAGTLAAHTVRLLRERERMLEATRNDGTTENVPASSIAEAWDRYRREGAIERRIYGSNGDQPKTAVLAADTKPAECGTTAKFGTGAIRSDTFEQLRYDLISPIGLREVARTCAEGAAKYSDFNWERGMPVHDLLNHALAHIFQFLSGDRGEPHLPHAAWNLLAAIHSAELWPQLNEGTLRGPGCTPPSTT